MECAECIITHARHTCNIGVVEYNAICELVRLGNVKWQMVHEDSLLWGMDVRAASPDRFMYAPVGLYRVGIQMEVVDGSQWGFAYT